MTPLNRNNTPKSSGYGRVFRLPLAAAVWFLVLAMTPGTEPSGLVAQDDRAFVPEGQAPKMKKDEPEPAASEETGAAEGEAEEAKAPEMSRLFPIGRPFKGVRIPSYTGDSLTSVVEAEVMRRMDERFLDLEQLVITSFGEGEKTDTRIFMDRAIYDMTSEKLTSRSPTRIVQPEFEMVGDRMVFDNKTQVGHMTGNVKMRIFKVDHAFSGGMLGGAGKEGESE